MKEKSANKAMYGWYRYITRFALPAKLNGIIIHYNIYLATLIVRKDFKGRLNLYDVVNIKKESEGDF